MTFLVQFIKRVNPYLSSKCMVLLLGVLFCVYLFIHLWISPNPRAHSKWESRFRSGFHYVGTKYKKMETIPDGEGVWIEGRRIQIMSAIHDLHYNKTDHMRIILPSFLQHNTNRQFVCCFSSHSNPSEFAQVEADLEYLDLRFMTDIQNAAFECVLKGNQVRRYDQVLFAAEDCNLEVTQPLRVIYPMRRTFEFAVCTKVAYNRLEPQRLLEWFEFMKEMGVSRVLTFHSNLHPDSRAVFDYYQEQGLLEFIHYKPREINGTPALIYTQESAQTRQARQEKTLTVRDCQFRLAGYDFVFTIDFDEIPVPLRPHGSLSRVFETLSKAYPDAGAFRLDPILLPPEWRVGKKSFALYHWQFHDGTYIDGYCTKWMYIPSRTKFVATHEVEPKAGFKTYALPQDVLHFLHFRTCKEHWHEVSCQNLTQAISNEYSLKRFMGNVLRRLRRMPLVRFELDERFVNILERNS